MSKLQKITDIFLTGLASVLCGLGCGFLNGSGLGMDAVGIFYDGIRALLRFDSTQIGIASYVVSILLSLFLWFADRRYVSLGSVLYILLYGYFANIGTILTGYIPTSLGIYGSAAASAAGLLVLYIGIGLFIAVDMGVDAFTGVNLWICDITGFSIAPVKIVFDLSLTLFGIFLGGVFGPVSVISVFIAGPCVAFTTKRFQALYFKRRIKKELSDV